MVGAERDVYERIKPAFKQWASLVIHAGTPIRAHLEIKTKLGGEFNANEVVITVSSRRSGTVACRCEFRIRARD